MDPRISDLGMGVGAPPIGNMPKKSRVVIGNSMSKRNVSAGQWMAENGHLWGPKNRGIKQGKRAKEMTGPQVRDRRALRLGGRALRDEVRSETIKEFVERNRRVDRAECLFVPGAQKEVPAAVIHCGKTISAARYMLLLTQGTPKWENAYATHKCGNGHLSCVNPNCLKWGDPSTNASDAAAHRHCDTVEEKVSAVDRLNR